MLFQRLAVAGLLMFASHAAPATERGSGTLTLGELELQFTNEVPALGLNLTSDPARLCLDPALPCDQYGLAIELPEDLPDYFPDAQVRILMSTTGPSGLDDLDLYLLDADGNEIAASGNFQTPESIGFLANGGTANYTVEVQYYIALGTTYTVDVSLALGQPSEELTEEEVAQWLSDNGGSMMSRAETIPATCADPGVTVLTDNIGDGGLTVIPVPGTDLQQLDVFQTTDADGLPLIALRLTVDDLSSPIPQSVYFASFNTSYGDVRGVRMEIDSQGAISYWSYRVGEDNDGERGSTPLSRTHLRRPIMAARSVHVEEKKIQRRVQTRCC